MEQPSLPNTEQRIKNVICDILGVNPEDVTDSAIIGAWNPDKPETRHLGADSLDAVELVMAAEEEFEIEITDEDAEKIKTVADAVGLVKRLTGEEL